jgi:hypothetical protein
MPLKFPLPVLVFLLIARTATVSGGSDESYLLSNARQGFRVEPSTFSLYLSVPGEREFLVAMAPWEKEFEAVKTGQDHISWTYPSSGISVTLKLNEEYLSISIHGGSVAEITWPRIIADIDAYTIPLHQGKFIPAGDSLWARHLETQGRLKALEALSMQFFALNVDEIALVFVIENIFNNRLDFYRRNGKISLDFTHEFPETTRQKEFGFRIYPVPGDITRIAKSYRSYVLEKQGIMTLEEKAGNNPGIRKLYGAPHIYAWNNEFLVEENVRDRAGLGKRIFMELSSGKPPPSAHLFRLLIETTMGRNFMKDFQESGPSFLNTAYGLRLFIHSVNELLSRHDFFDADAFSEILQKQNIDLPAGGPEGVAANAGIYQLNKLLFYHLYSDFLEPVDKWGGTPPGLILSMYEAGIKKAWLGLNCRTAAEIHPGFVLEANRTGYLIGPYDSYHSIHPPGEERWVTATFDDTTLYHTAYIMNGEREPVRGFMGVGRKLNPLMAFPSVRSRTKGVFDQGIEFNSWFMDCDATGECYDDFTPSRMSSQRDDMEARLQRMAWIANEYDVVMGSETGNDYSANTIAFAHGMTTPVIAWGDPDMRSDRDSEYYVGAYYSMWGGIPPRYVKPVPLKDEYRYIYYDNRFNIPLFQLVYNDAVITSHHWEWGSLKVPDEIPGVSLREILYNVPPLYHLDRYHWDKYKKTIIRHAGVFGGTHSRAVTLEMTGFDWLSADRLVQRTRFGESLEIIANFGTEVFRYDDMVIEGQGLAVHDMDTGEYFFYYP